MCDVKALAHNVFDIVFCTIFSPPARRQSSLDYDRSASFVECRGLPLVIHTSSCLVVLHCKSAAQTVQKILPCHQTNIKIN
jgi:hypothetical protein